MLCPNCGRQIPDGSKFCPYCGEKIAYGGTSSKKEVSESEVSSEGGSGSLVNNNIVFLESYKDGTYVYCSGTVSSDGRTIDGWKYSYCTLAIPLSPFKITHEGS
ncbi:zinc ribbon domain-containing protein [Caldisericum sp.]|uniref:zinc ribbon domain-containing protein n=1 Tax=Caldisericum sp. TaxID=2499687 RepID=UPI003D096908